MGNDTLNQDFVDGLLTQVAARNVKQGNGVPALTRDANSVLRLLEQLAAVIPAFGEYDSSLSETLGNRAFLLLEKREEGELARLVSDSTTPFLDNARAIFLAIPESQASLKETFINTISRLTDLRHHVVEQTCRQQAAGSMPQGKPPYGISSH